MLHYRSLEEAELALGRNLTLPEKLWYSYSAEKSDYILYNHNWLFMFFVLSLVPFPCVFFELFWFNNMEKFKLQPRIKRSFPELFKCYKDVAVNKFILVAGPLIAVSFPAFKWVGIRTSLPLPSKWEVISQLVVYFLIEDYTNYWIHRLLHSRWAYENIHYMHHEYNAPFGFAAPYAHWAEILILGIPTFLGPAMVPCHMITLWLWTFLRQAEAIDTHSGYNFPWSLTKFIPFYGGAEYHDYHHYVGRQSQSNFASVFTYCDYVYGTDKEYVYGRLQFSYGWYFTFVLGFVYLFLIYLQGFTPKQMVNPWKTYVKLSAVLMGSHGLTKGSLAFLNYPAQLMFKSTKVLSVMVMGAFIPGLRRIYPAHEYVSAILLVMGLILFTLADVQTSPNFSVIGVVMMEMLFCSTVVGLPFLIPPMLLTGELFKAWNSCSQHLYVYGVLFFEAMATFIGQVSVLSLIAIFGAATTAMVTTARKAVTLLLSYLIFTKPLTEQHGTGLLLLAIGITLKLLPVDSKPAYKRVISNDRSSSSTTNEKIGNSSSTIEEMRIRSEIEEEKTPLV
ncbi:hypothetical protein CRYUN_Cryun14cG0027400 [Craigia yunnanensis]